MVVRGDPDIECQIIFISDLLNISIQLLTLSIIITILTIYGHKNDPNFDYMAIFNLMNHKP